MREDAAVAAVLRARGSTPGSDPGGESAALAGLAQQLADDPGGLLERVAELARALCGADSVVIAVCEPPGPGREGAAGEAGADRPIRWCTVAGRLAPHQGARWPAHDCPCGAPIVSEDSVLFEQPADDFASIRATGLRIGETLGVPWRVRGRTVGSLNAMMLEGADRRFRAEDLRRLRDCAAFAAAAHRNQEAGAAAPDDGELERQVEARLRPVLEREEYLQREVEESRAAERALREHKALIDATLSIGTVGVLYFDLDGTVRDVNAAFERMTGYSCGELRTLPHWRDLTPPEFWDITERALRDLAGTGTTAPYTKQMIRKDGSRWWGLFAPARIGGDGASGRCVLFVIDVSENKLIEERLAESEERFRAMVEGLAQAVWETDGQGRMATPSASWLAYTGQRPEASLGLGWIDAAHPDDRAAVLRQWRAAVGLRRMLDAEFRVQVAAGGWRWTNARAAPLFGTDGEVRKWVGMCIDIDERRRTEDLLAESERRFRMLFEAMDEGFLLGCVEFDEAGRPSGIAYTEANPAAARMAHISCVEPGRLRMRPEHEPCWLDACAQVVRTGASSRSQCFAPALSSWYDFFVFPVGGRDSTRVAILFYDITLRKRAEDALRESEAALRDADRRKDEFLAMLAHELRNPLAPISNAVQLMRRPDGRRQSDRVVEMVGRQVRQIVRLVDDLMEVSRIARGKIDLKLERVPFAEIVHGAIETSQPAIERAGHQLAVALPAEPLVLEGDRVRLTQVFANLLNNAAKYTDAGGRIWFDVRREGETLVASVRDTGIGIPAGELPRVFDMFAQAHRSVGRGQGGLGIGLTMVRSLVEMHHGSVEAHSAGSGLGSEFVVRLPLAAPDRAPAPVLPLGQARPEAPLHGQRVLVVDDNRDAADTLGLLLEADGAEVRVVYDGRSALAAAETFLPTSILLDIGMPGMDGYEVAHRLRQDGRFAGVRIVALTGWGQEVDRRQTRNRGFSDHLTKPVGLEELHASLA